MSGTFFERVRRFQPWLAAIWFIEKGVEISAAELARLVGVAPSTSLSFLKKLSFVIEDKMGRDVSTIPSVNFILTFMRRSKETPAGKHPRDEEKTALGRAGSSASRSLHQFLIHRANRTPRPAPTQKDIELEKKLIGETEKQILLHLSHISISFDELIKKTGLSIHTVSAALMNLELFEFAERLPGDQFIIGVRAERVETENANNSNEYRLKQAVVSKFRTFVRVNYGGISRKYLQNYVALLWAFSDKKRWRKGSLMKACIAHREVPDDELLRYVTPLKVSAPLAIAA